VTEHGNAFASQSFPPDAEGRVIRHNMLIDFAFGHRRILRDFAREHTDFASYFRAMQSLTIEDVASELEVAKKDSLLMTVLMLTGQCDANCAICYTDRKARFSGLQADEFCAVLDQTYALGSRLLYIPGEGEPTLDDSFWIVVEHAHSLGMETVLFTNGILLSKDAAVFRKWRMTAEEAVLRLASCSVSVYHKLWSVYPEKLARLMGIKLDVYDWAAIAVNGRRYTVPRGLRLLLENMPRNRVGIQVVAGKASIVEISEKLIPLVQGLGIKSYIEPPLHSGRNFGVRSQDPCAEELGLLGSWLARSACPRIVYEIVVHNDGIISPGMAFRPTDLFSDPEAKGRYSVRNSDGSLRDIFSLIHEDPFLAWCRYQISGCLCQQINDWLASHQATRPEGASAQHSAGPVPDLFGAFARDGGRQAERAPCQ